MKTRLCRWLLSDTSVRKALRQAVEELFLDYQHPPEPESEEDLACPVEIKVPDGYYYPWNLITDNAKEDLIEEFTGNDQLLILAMLIAIQKSDSTTSNGLPEIKFIEELTGLELTGQKRDDLWKQWLMRDISLISKEG